MLLAILQKKCLKVGFVDKQKQNKSFSSLIFENDSSEKNVFNTNVWKNTEIFNLFLKVQCPIEEETMNC